MTGSTTGFSNGRNLVTDTTGGLRRFPATMGEYTPDEPLAEARHCGRLPIQAAGSSAIAGTVALALWHSGKKFSEQAVSQIDGASKLFDLFSLPTQLLLNFCDARQLQVESLAEVVELILHDGKNVGRRHRRTGWPSRSRQSHQPRWPGRTRRPASYLCGTFSALDSLRRYLLSGAYRARRLVAS